MNGNILKNFWKESGLTQKELAVRLGISQSALTQQFNSNDVRTGTVENFCDILNLKINDLYKGTPYYSETVPQIVVPGNNDSIIKWLQDKIDEKDHIIKEKDDKIGELIDIIRNEKRLSGGSFPEIAAGQ